MHQERLDSLVLNETRSKCARLWALLLPDARLMLAAFALLVTLLPWYRVGGSGVSPFLGIELAGNLGLELGSMLAFLSVAALLLSIFRSRAWELIAAGFSFLSIVLFTASIHISRSEAGLVLEILVFIALMVDSGEWATNELR